MPEKIGNIRRRGSGMQKVQLVQTNVAQIAAVGGQLVFSITDPADFGMRSIKSLNARLGVDPAVAPNPAISETDGATFDQVGVVLNHDVEGNIIGADMYAYNMHAAVAIPALSAFCTWTAIGF